jgi:hypothetical protein
MNADSRRLKLWSAVAKRPSSVGLLRRVDSGDTAFPAPAVLQKRRGALLPAAVQNPWLRLTEPRSSEIRVHPRLSAVVFRHLTLALSAAECSSLQPSPGLRPPSAAPASEGMHSRRRGKLDYDPHRKNCPAPA